MRFSSILFSAFSLLIYPALISTVILYLYPIFLKCDFPAPSEPQRVNGASSRSPSTWDTEYLVPFRLLVFGDPQLEGDTSLPSPDDPYFPSLDRLRLLHRGSAFDEITQILRAAATDFVYDDIPLLLYTLRKRIDLPANDFYLAHIYRTLHWWLAPTHVAVVGDLLGSQWISDEEFERRSDRFWNRVFRHGKRLEDELTSPGSANEQMMGQDEIWSRRVLNAVGNHDVGYAGDLTPERLERFEKAFGKANWDIKFRLPSPRDNITEGDSPTLQIVNLNSMNLDGPARSPELQQQTYDFINNHLLADSLEPLSQSHSQNGKSFTILLTHLPLYKPDGICVDGPYFTYHPDATIREQNHLSRHASRPILEGIFGMSGNQYASGSGLGRPGVVLTGHDHEGCDVYHYVPEDVERDGNEWHAAAWNSNDARSALRHRRGKLIKERPSQRSEDVESHVPGIREITLRSMMGMYSGSAGLLSAWFDWQAEEWHFEFTTCAMGSHVWWWVVHILDLVTAGVLLAACLTRIIDGGEPEKAPAKRKKSTVSRDGSTTPRPTSRRSTSLTLGTEQKRSRSKKRTEAEKRYASTREGSRAGSTALRDTPRHRTVKPKIEDE